jgi:predicted peptidase
MNIKAFFTVILTIIIWACNPQLTMMTGKQAGQEMNKEIVKRIHMHYLLYLPEEYGSSDQDWPLLVFLHGMGERGDDIEKVKVHGPAKLIEAGKKFPFIVVSPQCPDDQWWDVDVLHTLIQDIASTYKVDDNRIYLTGLSMGGYGTWALASKYPDTFAAIAPICGGGDVKKAALLKNIPVWAFHGAKDPVVPRVQSEQMIAAVKKAGGDAKLTVYPKAGHDSWTETYNNQKLYDWLLAQKKIQMKNQDDLAF